MEPARGPGDTRNSARGVEHADRATYQDWRDCIEMARPKRVALPLGDFKAPTTGWVVVTGRRGHYDFATRRELTT
jgi:hypothetical protein